MSTSRIPSAPERRVEPFGLFAIIETQRVILPLKGVECDFLVVSGLVEVSMTQIFRQENKRPLDCEYLFPLPADAAVFECEADINGRVIRAQVRERQEARKLAAEKKAAGFRTTLVEAERDNLFTLGLTNVQPDDLVIIKLKYFQTLRFLAGQPSLEIPFCPGIRYIPGSPLLRSNKGKGTADDSEQVPDASRITPVRVDSEHPDAAFVDVRGTLDAEFVDAAAVASPSHQLNIHQAGKEVRLSLSDKAEVPDRDLVLRWREKAAGEVRSRAWLCKHGDEDYALLEVRAPQAGTTERAPVDFYFMIDRSGSMNGEKWDKAAQALRSCVQVLKPNDRVMITLFESGFRDFAEAPQPVSDLLNDRQFQQIAKIGTAGGTELRPALNHVLEVARTHSAGKPRNLILITDAQIGNDQAILELMKTAPRFPVHCFGIDVALNDALLLALTRQQGGTFHSLNPRDDIEQAVRTLGQTLGQPVLLDLALPAGWETAEASIPNLYAGQIHYLSARSSKGASPVLSGKDATGRAVKMEFAGHQASFEAPWLHWCRSRLQRYVAEGNRQGAIDLSLRSNLICPLTAFVAWDEAEKVAVASHELVQPNLKLAGHFDYSLPMMEARPRLAQQVSLRPRATAARTRGGGSAGLIGRLMEKVSGYSTAEKPSGSENDEIALRRGLSDLCHRLAIPDWEDLVKLVLDGLRQTDASERRGYIENVMRLIETMGREVRRLESAATGLERERERLRTMLKEFINTNSARKEGLGSAGKG